MSQTIKLKVFQGTPIKPENWREMVKAQLEGATIPNAVYGADPVGAAANGFRRMENPNDVGRDNVFGRTSSTSPEYKTDWKSGAGMSSPGIGERAIEWPSYGSNSPAGGANATCQTCGGRMRGAKTCTCAEPDWKVQGKPLVDEAGLNESQRQKHLFQEWNVQWLTEAYRVLRPGGIIKAFSGTRTQHRLAMAMEQAGFELEPESSLFAWVYGSGFPKSLNISAALEKQALAAREKAVVQALHARGFADVVWSTDHE